MKSGIGRWWEVEDEAEAAKPARRASRRASDSKWNEIGMVGFAGGRAVLCGEPSKRQRQVATRCGR